MSPTYDHGAELKNYYILKSFEENEVLSKQQRFLDIAIASYILLL